MTEFLSQDEIDALLHGADDVEPETPKKSLVLKRLTSDHRNVLFVVVCLRSSLWMNVLPVICVSVFSI